MFSGEHWWNDLNIGISILLILLGSILISKLVKRGLKRYFENQEVDKGRDQTNYAFLKNGVNALFLIAAIILIFYVIPPLRALGLTLFASAGIFAAILGLASQQAFSNIISGIFIVIFKPFRLGDIIKVGNSAWGTVEDITLRHTVIKSFQNERYVIPNSTMSSETILNASIGELQNCMFIEMGISYDSDTDKAMEIMQRECENHPACLDLRKEEDLEAGKPKVMVRLVSFGDSSVNLRAYAWAQDPINGFIMKTELFKSIKKRFDQEGIEIPYPHRTIVYKNEKN